MWCSYEYLKKKVISSVHLALLFEIQEKEQISQTENLLFRLKTLKYNLRKDNIKQNSSSMSVYVCIFISKRISRFCCHNCTNFIYGILHFYQIESCSCLKFRNCLSFQFNKLFLFI